MNKPLFLSIKDRNRQTWAENRAKLEEESIKTTRHGKKKKRYWNLFDSLIYLFGRFLKLVGLFQRGRQNSLNVIVKQINLDFEDLPEAFEQYKILHITDLHLDSITGIENVICKQVESISYDLCVMTGDYRAATKGGFQDIIKPMKQIVRSMEASDGVWATLGNHDTYLMADEFEKMGIGVLANEKVTITRKGQVVELTGVDDPHYYFTSQAENIMKQPSGHFKVALVHSPELYDIAEENQYRLYLCGHTHGGQICLPGGIPIITHLNHGRRFYSGQWNHNQLQGYTSQGCGVVGLPVRFNTQSEVTLITLRKKSKSIHLKLYGQKTISLAKLITERLNR